MSKKYRGIFAWSIVSLAVIGFIFSNSAATRAASDGLSSGFADFIYSLVAPILSVSFESFHVFVRKAAHFTEFAALGVSVWMIAWSVRKLCGQLHAASAFLAALAVAVTDEFIQSFTDRSSAVADIILDFSGAVFGIVITATIVYLANIKKEPSKPS